MSRSDLTSATRVAAVLTNVRIARPTSRLEEVVRFYVEGLGFERLGSFEGHDGYDGVMIGAPGEATHLEFTRRGDDGPFPPPSRDNLLVFYFDDPAEVETRVAALAALGYEAVEPENPYWRADGVTIPDPDGWHVVLMRRRWS